MILFEFDVSQPLDGAYPTADIQSYCDTIQWYRCNIPVVLENVWSIYETHPVCSYIAALATDNVLE